ncbi:MAG: LysM peptidoglycan-binding domain-containing protein [Thermoleophilia bacterium]|nr:LysM peptidoglycan-binding domain-containing protein [Thermoleophilia bacterium]
MSGRRTQLHAVAESPMTRRAVVPGSRSLGRSTRRHRRRRRMAGLIRFCVFLLLIFVAVWAGVRVAHAGEDAAIYTGHEYTVATGDDLWTIAGDEYGADSDMRAAVYAIRTANGLESSVLQPGQTLTLPYLGD